MPYDEITSPPSPPPPLEAGGGRFFRNAVRRVRNFFTGDAGFRFLLHVLLAGILAVSLYVFSGWSQSTACAKAERWLNLYNGAGADTGVNFCADADTAQQAAARLQPAGASSNRAASAPASSPQPEAAPASAATPAASPAASPTASPVASPANGPTPTPTCTPPAEAYQQRLDEQMNIVRARANHHGEVMAFFYKNYYMATSVVLLAGVVAAVALFFIAQKGWGPTNEYVKNVFVVTTAAVAYFGLFPPVFEQQKNISDNKELFLQYKTVENELRSFPKTCGNLKKEANTPDAFINYVDSELNRLGNIAIGFDYTKIDYKGAFELNDGKNGGDGAPGNQNSNTPARPGGGRQQGNR